MGNSVQAAPAVILANAKPAGSRSSVAPAPALPGLGRDGFSPSDRWNSRAVESDTFSFGDAGKAFGKGLVAPFVKVYQAFKRDPLLAGLITVGGAVVVGGVVTPVVLAFPAAAPFVAGALAAPGLWQLGKGAIAAVKNYRNGNYNASEQAFGEVGEGTMKAALAALPVLKLGRFARTPGGKSFGNSYLDSLAEASKNAPKMYVSPTGGGVSLTPISFGPNGPSMNIPIN